MWFVGLDAHVDTTALSIRSARGTIVQRKVVPTTAVALRRALSRTRGRVKIACEAGPLAPWLKRVLETQLREVIVCDRRRTRLAARGGPKSDKFDADRLSECLRNGSVHAIHVPNGTHLEIRRYLLHYVRVVRDQRRINQRIKALFLESGMRVPASRTTAGGFSVRALPPGAARDVARAYMKQMETAKELVASARSLLIQAASKDPAFELLQTIPQIGEIRSATLLGIVGTADRFRARRKFWSYGGLGVIQRVSAEHRIEQGKVVRDWRARGVRLSKAGQPLLKKVLSDIALHASVGRGELRAVFDHHVGRGKRPAIARLALARKVASIILAVWRSGEPYNPARVKRKKVSGRASIPQLSRERANARKATALSICRPESRFTQGTG